MSKRMDDLLKAIDDKRFFMEHTVERNIAAHRKGEIRLKLTGEEGVPISNAKVSVRQKGHDFLFGCNLFMLDEFETNERNAMYREKFKELMNYGVIPFYWDALEPEQGKPRFSADSPKFYRRPAPDLAVEYCEKNGIRRKGHCLVYHSFMPKWMPTDVPGQKRVTEAHIREIADRYSTRIQDWDVENENLGWYKADCYRVYEEPDYLEWCFTEADRAFSGENRLFINEASYVWNPYVRNGYLGVRSPYYMQVARLLAAGLRVDCVGLQFHRFLQREDELAEEALPFDPVHLYEVMDCYARLGRPLQISEVTIPAYECTPEDEAAQAELTKLLYRVWFSHPAADAIVWWNLVDGYASSARPKVWEGENRYSGGLLRNDMSEKPVYQALRELILQEWNTCEELCTDENGEVTFEGFFGEYSLSVNGKDAGTFHLAKGDRYEKGISLA